MKTYNIFHPVDGSLNRLCSTNMQFKKVASVQADSLSNAFALSQNFHENSYTLFNIRSTSVGDIIVSDLGAFMIKGAGFEEIHDFSTQGEELVNNMTADLDKSSNDVQSFSFEWDNLRKSRFPRDIIHEIDLGIEEKSQGPFKSIITIYSAEEEEFDMKTIFELGMYIGIRTSVQN